MILVVIAEMMFTESLGQYLGQLNLRIWKMHGLGAVALIQKEVADGSRL